MSVTPAGAIAMVLAAGLAAAAAGGYVYFRPDRPGNATGVPAPKAAGSDVSSGLAARDPGASGTSDRAGSDAAPQPEPPRFDLVRVAPDGSGLVAGRAAPGARIRIRSGETTLAEVEAGPSGEFATIFRADPEQTPQMLALEAEPESGARVRSEERVLLLPPAPDASAGSRPEDAPQAAWSPAAGGTEPDPAGDAAEEDAVAATAIIAPDAPAEAAAALDPATAAEGLSLASIDYAEDGSVRLAGAAPAGARLRIYVDDTHSEDRVADSDGRWEASLDGIEEGVYRIRIDAVAEDGAVTARVETPFQRTFPPAAAAGTVTVQPGNNLWTIARTRYGAGIQYTQIFTANADLIENPDLIYPGQIFVLPDPEPDGEGSNARQ